MNNPKRIWRRRVKGWRKPPNTISVTRPGKWGNQFKPPRDGTAEECVEKFKKWYLENNKHDQAEKELRGKNLMCFCKPWEPCHADFLLDDVNK